MTQSVNSIIATGLAFFLSSSSNIVFVLLPNDPASRSIILTDQDRGWDRPYKGLWTRPNDFTYHLAGSKILCETINRGGE